MDAVSAVSVPHLVSKSRKLTLLNRCSLSRNMKDVEEGLQFHLIDGTSTSAAGLIHRCCWSVRRSNSCRLAVSGARGLQEAAAAVEAPNMSRSYSTPSTSPGTCETIPHRWGWKISRTGGSAKCSTFTPTTCVG